MSTCNFTAQISGSECIGDSRTKINSNFDTLDSNLCSLIATVSAIVIPGSNKLINGDMNFDQRAAGSTFVYTYPNYYGSCDRWASYCTAHTGSGLSLTQVQTSTTDFPYALRFQRTSGSTATSALYVGQVIETQNCIGMAGRYVTLSYYANAGTNFSGTNVTVKIITGSGKDQGWVSLVAAGWTGIATPLSTNIVPTTTQTRFVHTVAIPAGTNEVAVQFVRTGVGTAGTNDYVDITGVQLETGIIATPFEYLSYTYELILCQRYYEKLIGALQFNDSVATSTFCWMFKVRKRVTPTVYNTDLDAVASHSGQIGALSRDSAMYVTYVYPVVWGDGSWADAEL